MKPAGSKVENCSYSSYYPNLVKNFILQEFTPDTGCYSISKMSSFHLPVSNVYNTVTDVTLAFHTEQLVNLLTLHVEFVFVMSVWVVHIHVLCISHVYDIVVARVHCGTKACLKLFAFSTLSIDKVNEISQKIIENKHKLNLLQVHTGIDQHVISYILWCYNWFDKVGLCLKLIPWIHDICYTLEFIMLLVKVHVLHFTFTTLCCVNFHTTRSFLTPANEARQLHIYLLVIYKTHWRIITKMPAKCQ